MLILFILVSINLAFALSDFVSTPFVKILNSPPKLTMGSPTDNQVIITTTPLIKWSYNDKEANPQREFLIQYDTTRFFEDGVIEAGIGSKTEHILRIRGRDGQYYVRVKAKDDYGWGPWSDFRAFYLDTTAKLCSDSTPYYACSRSQPAYCDGGVLINDCYECGCPSGSSCSKEGLCQILTCSDGTAYGKCSAAKPKYCSEGKLIEFASHCSCPVAQEPQLDGSCKPIIQAEEPEEPEPKIIEEPKPSLLQRISSLFKNILIRITR